MSRDTTMVETMGVEPTTPCLQTVQRSVAVVHELEPCGPQPALCGLLRSVRVARVWPERTCLPSTPRPLTGSRSVEAQPSCEKRGQCQADDYNWNEEEPVGPVLPLAYLGRDSSVFRIVIQVQNVDLVSRLREDRDIVHRDRCGHDVARLSAEADVCRR